MKDKGVDTQSKGSAGILSSSFASSLQQRLNERPGAGGQHSAGLCVDEERTRKSNYQYALNFILFLLQSTLDRIETGKDFICRCFFKLIQQMHQDQVINELLNNQDGEDGAMDHRSTQNQPQQSS